MHAQAIAATLLTVALFLSPVILLNRLAAAVRRRQRLTRRMRRASLRSSKADAKRAAKKYAEEIAGKPLGWKAARKLLTRLEREGRRTGAIA